MSTRRDRGATIPIVALVVPVLLLMTSFAVDLGRQQALRRDLQANADVISLDLVRLIESPDAVPNTADTLTALNDSLEQNDLDPVTATSGTDGALVQWGHWDPPPASQVCPRTIVTEPPSCFTEGVTPVNAVRVTLDGELDYFFQPGTGSAKRSAIASQKKKAGFSIGSFAASLSSGSGTLLNGLVGDALNLGVLSYSGLATVNLTYLDIATELGLGTPEELFAGNVSALEVVQASAAIIQRNNPSAAELTVLNQIIAAPASGLNGIGIEDVVGVSTGSEDAALASTFNLYDFVAGAAFIANGSSALGVPTISLGPPGFNLGGSLSLIQAPVTVYGGIGDFAQTSQADSTLTSTVGTLALGNFVVSSLSSVIPGICGLLLLGPLLCGLTQRAIRVELVTSVTVDLASARGTIADIRCPGTKELDIDIASQLLTASIGITAVIKSGTTTLGSFPLSVLNTRPAATGTADFVIPPDAFNVFKPSAPAVGSLTGNTTITGLGALGPLLTVPLNTLLNGIVTNVNTQLVTPLAAALGARVASADVTPRAVDCRSIALVG